MSLFHLILLALIQGITEFLPVSSSGHLVLLPNLTGMDDQGQLLDVAVHVGTLGAVILYFWRDVRMGLMGIPRMLTFRIDTPGSKLAFLLMIATIPVIIAGLILHLTGLSDALRSIAVIGWTMLLFGILLYVADQRGAVVNTSDNWTLRHAIVMGLWQAVALIPGTSRSGITITAGRMLGYDRESAARLAMLMSIPTIAASGVLLGRDMMIAPEPGVIRDASLAAGMAFLSALAALAIMMRLLKSVSFTPYVIYRVALGIILLVIAYS